MKERKGNRGKIRKLSGVYDISHTSVSLSGHKILKFILALVS